MSAESTAYDLDESKEASIGGNDSPLRIPTQSNFSSRFNFTSTTATTTTAASNGDFYDEIEVEVEVEVDGNSRNKLC